MKRIFTILLFLLSVLGSTVVSAQTEWLWAKSAGNNSYDYGNSVASDNAGNSFFTGSFNATIVFDPQHTFTSAGSSDMFIIKYDVNGNLIWANAYGGNDGDIPMGIVTDKQGNIYVAGYFKSASLVFGTYTLTNAGGNTYDIYLVKYDPSGNVLWATGTGGTGDDRANAVALDSAGNVFITGYFVSSSVAFGGFVLNNSGAQDIYIAKYAPNGNVLWANSAAGTGTDYSYGVAADKFGNSYIAGDYNSTTLTFGPIVLTGPANRDIFLAKYSPAGLPLWGKTAGVNSDNTALSVAVDTNANVFISGYFKSTSITFGTTPALTNHGHYDMFLAKYNTAGDALWSVSAGGANEDGARAVAVDKAGYSYLGGYFKSPSITIGSTTLNNSYTTSDIVFAEFNPDGTPVLVKQAGGSGDDVPYSVAIDSLRNFFIAGYFASPTLQFGPTTLTCGGTTDPFLVRSTNIPLTGVDENKPVAGIKIYPNPASEKINISLTVPSDVEIYNSTGTMITRFYSEESKTTVDIRNYVPGIYFVRITGGEKVNTSKFVKE